MPDIFAGNRDRMGRYIREMADRMGLRDWTIVFSADPPGVPDRAGECEVTYGTKHAVIRLASNWPQDDPAEVRDTVVHELLHCHLEPLRWSLNNIKHAVGGDLYNVIYDGFTDHLEVAIDSMARAWTETLPLPATGRTRTPKAG